MKECMRRRGSTLVTGGPGPSVSFIALSRWNWIARNRVGSGDQAPRIFGLEPRLCMRRFL
jgi:hypothetical protein